MALRPGSCNSTSLSLSTTARSHLVGLQVYWYEVNSTPTMDWDKWLDLFQVAVMAKFSNSITELTSEVTEQTPRVRALLGDMDEDPANKKVVMRIRKRHLLITQRSSQKVIQRQVPYTTLWNLNAREFIPLAIILNMDNRLVIPQSMRQMIMCSLHYGHTGRDAMLGMIGDVWWNPPVNHRPSTSM